MNLNFSRRALRVAAAGFLALMVSPVAAQTSLFDINTAAQDLLRMFRPSVSGGFLAGQQAMKDLRTDEAARTFHQAAQADWDNPILLDRAFVALAADGRIAEASTTAKHLIELQPVSELAELVVATEALKERRYGAVERQLAEVGQNSFAGITAGILRGWALVGDGRGEEADALMGKLGADGLGDFLVFHRALMAQVSGDTDKALRYAEQAFEAEPFVPRIVEAYAKMLAADGQVDAALDVIDEFEAQGVKHPITTQLRATLEAGEKPDLFPSSVQVGAAEMFHGIGVALSRDGSADLALVFLRLAIYLDPAGDLIKMSVGELLDLAGQHEAANALYDAIPVSSPMKPTAVIRIAQNLDAGDNREEGIRRLRNIVALNPDDLQAVSSLGDMLSANEDWADAAETYSEALRISGGEAASDWGLYYVRGIAYERDGQWPKAEADFQKALTLNPDHPSVLNYLGYSWIDQDMHLDEALGMIEKAVAARPEDAYIIDSLGWAFYKLDRIDEAVETLERAVSILPNDPEINDHLGDAYWKVGRKREARFQWNIATSVDKEGKVAARAAPKLAEGLTPQTETE
ncbi:tetratricopeptide repeat protein [Devosia aurantiaca]|uniref:Tetratricopeptide repeat protein n=1 Tax=Devosia aurantiaca TaxID=2714858 RepID=A0A6M1SXB6_9HYPH|nr:tetratricopeptide repeat protein [Devosia aurantiaca]NGP17471.1 tetratricopeptide repeat protein [Devosia aurantiaca]